MSRQPDKLSLYVKTLIEQWIAAEPSRTAAQLARKANLTPVHISTIRSERRGVGIEALIKLAKALGTSPDRLIAAAKVWDGSLPAPEPQPMTSDMFVVYDERYPNRAKAATAAEALGYSEAAIREVQSMALKSDTDLEPEEWLDMIRSAHRRRELVRFPHEEEKERQHQEHRASERAREHAARGTFEERLAKAKAKKEKENKR